MSVGLAGDCIAYIRSNTGLPGLFGDSADTPKFWNQYADQESLPYVVFGSPGVTPTYSSMDGNRQGSYDSDGMLTVETYAQTLESAIELAKQVREALTDADDKGLSLTVGNLFYLRPETLAQPPIKEVGPDGVPTAYKQLTHFRFMSENNLQAFPP
jgi:hypothetical protein